MKYKLPVIFLPLFILLFIAVNQVKAVADHVVISEVQVAGASASDEFVELYNPTGSPIDLSGFRLTRKTASGSSENNLVASLSGIVEPLSYFLIAHPDYDGSTTPDFLYSATSSGIAINNIVTLYSDPGVTVVDKVGMGTATDFETATIGNPPTDGSVRRIDNDDTDDNSVDFEVLDVSDPQNSTFVTSTPTPSPTESPSPTPTETPIPTATETPSPTPALTPSPTASPSPTPSPTPTHPGRALGVFKFIGSTVECRLEYRGIWFGFLRVFFPHLVCTRT